MLKALLLPFEDQGLTTPRALQLLMSMRISIATFRIKPFDPVKSNVTFLVNILNLVGNLNTDINSPDHLIQFGGQKFPKIEMGFYACPPL